MSGRRSALALLLLMACAGARGHSPVQGIGHFYGGMLHPLVVPAHLMTLLVVGLWLGQRWPQASPVLGALLAALPVGLLASAGAEWPGLDLALLAIAAAVGGAVASAHGPVPRALPVVLAALAGLLLGLDSSPTGLAAVPRWLFIAGTWLGVLMCLACVIVLCQAAQRPWMQVGLRVVASWVVAAAVLVLALSWAGPKPLAATPDGRTQAPKAEAAAAAARAAVMQLPQRSAGRTLKASVTNSLCQRSAGCAGGRSRVDRSSQLPASGRASVT